MQRCRDSGTDRGRTDADPAELVTLPEPPKAQRQAAAPAVPAASLPPAAKEACPICGAEVDPAGRPLCARCRTEARKLAQPIDGYQIVRVIGKGGWALFTRASASRMAARWQ